MTAITDRRLSRFLSKNLISWKAICRRVARKTKASPTSCLESEPKLPPEILDEIFGWVALTSPRHLINLAALSSGIYSRVQPLLMERVILGVKLRVVKLKEYHKKEIDSNSAGFLDLITAKPQLAAHVKELYISDTAADVNLSSRIIELCPNLHHLACEVEYCPSLGCYSTKLVRLLGEEASFGYGGSHPLLSNRVSDLSGLRDQSSLRSLCLSIETFGALIKASTVYSSWTHSITHVEIRIRGYNWADDPFLPSPNLEVIPSVALLHNLTHFGIVHCNAAEQRRRITVDSVSVILNTASSLDLLVLLDWYWPPELQELSKGDDRVVFLVGDQFYNGTSYRTTGWEKQIDSQHGGLWIDAEDYRSKQLSLENAL